MNKAALAIAVYLAAEIERLGIDLNAEPERDDKHRDKEHDQHRAGDEARHSAPPSR